MTSFDESRYQPSDPATWPLDELLRAIAEGYVRCVTPPAVGKPDTTPAHNVFGDVKGGVDGVG